MSIADNRWPVPTCCQTGVLRIRTPGARQTIELAPFVKEGVVFIAGSTFWGVLTAELPPATWLRQSFRTRMPNEGVYAKELMPNEKVHANEGVYVYAKQ